MTNRIAVIVLALLFAAFSGTIMPGCEEHNTDHDNDHLETVEGHSDHHDDEIDHSAPVDEQHDAHDHTNSGTTDIH